MDKRDGGKFYAQHGESFANYQEQHLNWRQKLQRFLRSYRATPHALTGRSPVEVVFNGSQYRTRLPAKHSKVHPIYHQEIKNRNFLRKQAMKDYEDKTSYVINQ